MENEAMPSRLTWVLAHLLILVALLGTSTAAGVFVDPHWGIEFRKTTLIVAMLGVFIYLNRK